ncbi:MAG: hypothetical protein ACLTFJ_12905 [Clostridium sp.]
MIEAVQSWKTGMTVTYPDKQQFIKAADLYAQWEEQYGDMISRSALSVTREVLWKIRGSFKVQKINKAIIAQSFTDDRVVFLQTFADLLYLRADMVGGLSDIVVALIVLESTSRRQITCLSALS